MKIKQELTITQNIRICGLQAAQKKRASLLRPLIKSNKEAE